tara:strand:+ start:1082 stop:1669 length:588 start_codon:yes stop_codon:yes gene_type:complete
MGDTRSCPSRIAWKRPLNSSPFSLGTRILASGALLLSAFLLIGFLLPSSWESETTGYVAAPADIVFQFLDSPEGWQAWTPWPESGVERSGPERGIGATLSWDDQEVGTGSFTIQSLEENSMVTYGVEIGDGAMLVSGIITLRPESEGVRITWLEEGDLGRNPLMGYWALSMSRAQSDELVKGIERLRELALAGLP